MQAARAEAAKGSVLWLAVGSRSAAAVWAKTAGLQQVPNLTVQHWPVASAADTRAALQHLLQLVRSQEFTMVVLDNVQGLAPPPLRMAARLQPPGPAPLSTDPQLAAVAAMPALATGAPAAPSAYHALGAPSTHFVGAVLVGSPSVDMATGETGAREADAAATGVGVLYTAHFAGRRAEADWANSTGGRPGASDSATAGTAPNDLPARAVGPSPVAAAGRGPEPVQHRSPWLQQAASLGTGAPGAGEFGLSELNLKFLHNTLPVLLEDTLSQLAPSCGVNLRTTTLLLNSYSRPYDQVLALGLGPGGAGCGSSTSGSRGGGASGHGARGVASSRWAQRAIVRHATATLHLMRQQLTARTPAAGGGNSEGGGGHATAAAQGASSGADLHTEVTSGVELTGEDGPPRFIGSVLLPVRCVAPARSHGPD